MCTWQGITYFLDGYFFVFFVLTVVAIFLAGWASLAAVAKIERRSGGADWRKRMHKRWSRDDDGPSDQAVPREASVLHCTPIRSARTGKRAPCSAPPPARSLLSGQAQACRPARGRAECQHQDLDVPRCLQPIWL